MLLWNNSDDTHAARFGIGGDFLPAAGLAPANGKSWAQMAAQIVPLLSDLDFSVVNLECPVDVGGTAPRIKASLGDTFAAGSEVLEYAEALRASVIGIANNHLLDYGYQGAQRTLNALRQHGFQTCGFGRSLRDSPDVRVHQVEAHPHVRVGFWAAARNLPGPSSATAMGIEPATPERAGQALAHMRDLGVRCRVAYLHAGAEGTNFPDPEDVEFMDLLAASGFDIVAACHSHRISGHKSVLGNGGRRSFCFYGLGSISSGVMYSPLEHEGILAVIALNSVGSVSAVEARPIYLDPSGFGRVPSPGESALVLRRFAAISQHIRDGSFRSSFYQEISRDLLRTQYRDIRVAFRRAGLRGILQKLRRLRPGHFLRLYHKGRAALGLS